MGTVEIPVKNVANGSLTTIRRENVAFCPHVPFSLMSTHSLKEDGCVIDGEEVFLHYSNETDTLFSLDRQFIFDVQDNSASGEVASARVAGVSHQQLAINH